MQTQTKDIQHKIDNKIHLTNVQHTICLQSKFQSSCTLISSSKIYTLTVLGLHLNVDEQAQWAEEK